MSTSWFVRELSCQQVDCQRVDVSARCLSPVYDWHHNHRILIMRLHVIDLGWVENVRFTLRYVVSAGTGRLQLWDLWISVVFTIDVFWFLSWNRLISNCIYWKFRYIYIAWLSVYLMVSLDFLKTWCMKRYLRKLFLPIVYNGLSATIFCVTSKIVDIATT